MSRNRGSLFDRLWDRVLVGDGCWEWQGHTNRPDGYGRIDVVNRETYVVHRVVYVMLRGPIPDGLSLDHLCRNTRCVNPDHLEAVTHLVNVRRGLRGGITHCIRGHEFTEANTYHDPKGGRECRACRQARDRNKRKAA